MKLFQKTLAVLMCAGSFASISVASAQQACLQKVSDRDLLAEVSKRMRSGGSGASHNSNTLSIICRGSTLEIASTDRNLQEAKLSVDLIVSSNCVEASEQLTKFFRKATPGRAAIAALCRGSALVKIGITADGELKKVSETELIVSSRCAEARDVILGASPKQ